MATNPLNAYLSRSFGRATQKRGQSPDEMVRISFANFELRGTRLGFSDPWGILDAVPIICPSGRYLLEAECFRYGSDARIARVAATLAGRQGERGSLHGAFGVDVGNACIFDYDAIEGYADSAGGAFGKWVEDNINEHLRAQSGMIACVPAKTFVEYFSSGFGDGTYPVYELRDDYEIVGAETVFLEPGTPYAFGD
jgi:hypothetical protein